MYKNSKALYFSNKNCKISNPKFTFRNIFVSTQPAPIIDFSPIVTPPKMVAFAPIETPFLRIVF